MTANVSGAVANRVVERRRAVALARHYREEEGLPIRQIADRLGRSPATVKAYFYDPTGETARAVKARYAGVCRACGAPISARGGDAYAYCKKCHPGAIERAWTRERVREAMRAWEARYGQPTDLLCLVGLAREQARARSARAAAEAKWPPASTASEVYGSWAAACADAFPGG